jgi:nodulation protein E
MSADAHHITQPAPEGAANAMRKALKDASSSVENADSILDQVTYINAHGTGTQANDATEAAAIHQLFGTLAPKIPISSTKSLHGHSIGATGAIEALATIIALHEQQLPANAGVTEIDPTLNLDIILKDPRQAEQKIALSNSLAFGGLNAVLALRHHP